jgi:hypothetical protein
MVMKIAVAYNTERLIFTDYFMVFYGDKYFMINLYF